MHAVNVLLRSELAGALARLDAAESPLLRQRPTTAPVKGPVCPLEVYTPSVLQQGKEDCSHKTNSKTRSATEQCSPNLSIHRDSDRSPCRELQHQSMSFAQRSPSGAVQQQELMAESPNQDRLQAKHMLHDLASLLLISMTALQLRLERQLITSSSAKAEEPAHNEGVPASKEQVQDREQSGKGPLPTRSDAEAQLSHEHAQQLRLLEQRLQEEHVLTCQHMRDAHAQELKALQASHAVEKAKSATCMARSSSQRLAQECERITSTLTEEHVKTLESLEEPLQQQHAAAVQAMKQQHERELAESRASLTAELLEQHAAAERALSESSKQAHAASVQQHLAQQAEQLSSVHAQLVSDLEESTDEHLKALQAQLIEEHAVTCQRMHEAHARELDVLEHQLREQHAHACQDMRALHAHQMQGQQAQHAQEAEQMRLQVQQEMLAQHAQQTQEMKAEHAQGTEQVRLQIQQDMLAQHAQQMQDLVAQHASESEHISIHMEQVFSDECRRLEEEHECQLGLVQELAAEQTRAQLQGNRPVKP